MRCLLISVALACVTAGRAVAESPLETRLAEMSRTLVASFPEGSVAVVAVTDFSDLNGYQSALGKFVAEELTTQLAIIGSGRLSVIERRHLMKVLAEQKLGATSLFDPESVERIGRILGVQALITGSITDLGAELKVHARVLSVESGRVIGAASASIPNDETTKYLVRQVPGVASDAGVGSRPGPAAQPSGAFFENRFLRVTADKVGVSADRKNVTVSLVFTSLADEDVLIGLAEDNGNWCTVMLIDDMGVAAEATTNDDGQVSGLSCVDHYDRAEAESYTEITARSSTVVTLRFARRQPRYSRDPFDAAIKGRTAALSMDLFQLKGSKWSRFSIGVTNIALSP